MRSAVVTRSVLVVGFGLAMLPAGCGDDSDEKPSATGGASGASGAAGSNAGTAGRPSSGGSGGSGGSAGSGGVSTQGGTAGVPSTGGESGGGAAGSAGAQGGMSGSAGSTAGTGGTAGNGGGNAGSAGAAGSAGSSAGSAGASGAAGSAGQGGSSAGAAGNGGTSGAGGQPNCDDGNATTQDSYSAKYGCGHKYDANPSDDEAWMKYDSGFSIDLKTKLAWTIVAGSHDRDNVITICAALTRAGITDWRIPSINDTRTLASGCPGMNLSTCQLSDPSCLTKACGSCGGCEAGKGPNEGQYCKPDVTVCTHFHTSSLCSDCSSVSDWTYSPTNGNFLAYNPANAIGTICVADNITD